MRGHSSLSFPTAAPKKKDIEIVRHVWSLHTYTRIVVYIRQVVICFYSTRCSDQLKRQGLVTFQMVYCVGVGGGFEEGTMDGGGGRTKAGVRGREGS